MNTININEVLEELEVLSKSGTRVPGLRNRVMIDADRLTKVAEEMASAVPADVQEAQEILRQKDSIINQAQLEGRRVRESAEQESQGMLAMAQQKRESLIGDAEVVKAANLEAEEINQKALQEAQKVIQDGQRNAYRLVDDAEVNTSNRREGADQYARETLFELEEHLAGLLGQVRRGIDALGTEVEAKIPA